MLTVRFPDGTTVQYNTAHYLKYKASAWELYTKDPADGGAWVASISPAGGCIIEHVAACQVYNPVTSAKSALRFVMNHLRELPGSDLANLKSSLHFFNGTTRRWK